ncbi:MAG: alpha/beta hydrolase [Candidatus Thiodiazotropha sp.]
MTKATSPLINRFLLLLIIGTLLPTLVNGAQVREWFENESVFGGEVYLKSAGNPDNPAVVLVHGLGDEASTCWDDLFQRLPGDYFVLAFDLPGFGRSSKANVVYSPANYSRLIRQLTRKHVGKAFHLVGHSMGGAISLQYTHDYPDTVKTLTLVDPAGILHRQAYTKYLAPLGIDRVLNQYNMFDDRKVTNLAGALMSALEKRAPVNMDLLINLEPFRTKVLRGEPSAIAGLALVQNDFSRVPETIHQPTLIVWGEQDKIAPVRTGYMLESLIPNARLELIPGGHVAFIEQPQRFYDLLKPQLEQTWKPAPERGMKPAQSAYRATVECRGESDRVFSGRIGSLLIENCHNILVQDAEINSVVVIDSSVTLRNSRIISLGTALTAHNSTLTLTAGHVEGSIAIESYNSRLDIAGTQLVGQEAAVAAPVDSTLVFSLVRIDSPLYPDLVIHGMKIVSPGTSL